jgi:hypothetical protein
MERVVRLAGVGSILVLGLVSVGMVITAAIYRSEGDAAVTSLLGAALLAAGVALHAYIYTFLDEWRR